MINETWNLIIQFTCIYENGVRVCDGQKAFHNKEVRCERAERDEMCMKVQRNFFYVVKSQKGTSIEVGTNPRQQKELDISNGFRLLTNCTDLFNLSMCPKKSKWNLSK